ncbi:MAG: hypothetical protein BMS9Abin15_0832 [Gammaproteobacteria bacterium]|nr:MAG: hypothetical protein BMS9Abin15_0832 [Gammaproteobacteria bacterium]
MVDGAQAVMIWRNIYGGIFDLYEIIPGIVVALDTIINFSMATQKPRGL